MRIYLLFSLLLITLLQAQSIQQNPNNLNPPEYQPKQPIVQIQLPSSEQTSSKSQPPFQILPVKQRQPKNQQAKDKPINPFQRSNRDHIRKDSENELPYQLENRSKGGQIRKESLRKKLNGRQNRYENAQPKAQQTDFLEGNLIILLVGFVAVLVVVKMCTHSNKKRRSNSKGKKKLRNNEMEVHIENLNNQAIDISINFHEGEIKKLKNQYRTINNRAQLANDRE